YVPVMYLSVMPTHAGPASQKASLGLHLAIRGGPFRATAPDDSPRRKNSTREGCPCVRKVNSTNKGPPICRPQSGSNPKRGRGRRFSGQRDTHAYSHESNLREAVVWVLGGAERASGQPFA